MIQNQDLFALLHQRKCVSETIKIKGKVIRAWTIAASSVNRQTENYDDAIFEPEKTDL
jgi:hypothetical protein